MHTFLYKKIAEDNGSCVKRVFVASSPIGRDTVASSPIGRDTVASSPIGRDTVASSPIRPFFLIETFFIIGFFTLLKKSQKRMGTC